MIEAETIIDGRYRVIRRIGSGGMAEVYLAQDQLLGREVAVKVLHHHFAEDQEFVERFKREASAAAGLSHPNIVGVFDRGEWNGTYYIAMEYVAGRSLKALVRETGALEPAVAIDIAVQVLHAARFAHKRGVIHRDLKPHNVLIDEEGRVRVTDFGIARAGASDMTLTGSIMGTAQYLSPEQAQGYPVTVASDLYSVGVMLYELLTGEVPFEGDTAVAVAFKQVSAPPPAPSERNPAVPPALDAVVARALAKDPGARFADADEFIATLERERAALPASATVSAATRHGAVPLGGALLMAPAEAYAEQEPPTDRRRPWWQWAAVGLLAAGLVALALVLLLGSGHKVKVPGVAGQTEQAAVKALHHAGLVAAPKLAPSSIVPSGVVISQEPGEGIVVQSGSTVTITVSGGPSSAPLVGVDGLTASQAIAKVKAAGFVPVRKDQPSTMVPAGRVIGTEPPAGTETQLGSHVTVLVSSGPAPVRVPDVVGETQSAAESALSNAELKTGTVTQQANKSEAPGTVLAQSPAGGASVHAGDTVNLVVAQAPTTVSVPNVVGKSEPLASAALGEAGLVPRAVPQTAGPGKVEQVLSQNPAPGTKVKKGATVRISIGTLATPTTPTTPTAPTTPTTPTVPAPAP
jgi:serine/threonine-protein kinase